MKNFDVNKFNLKKIKLGETPLVLKTTKYKEPKISDNGLLIEDNNETGTKGDMYAKSIMNKILQDGCLDHNPRPIYKDFYEGSTYNKKENKIITKDNKEINLSLKDKINIKENGIEVASPAHTISVNDGIECTYDLSKGETPMITLRPIAYKSSVAEILWIYQKQSNDLVEFDEMLGKNTWNINHKINNWWNDWAIRDENGLYLLNEKKHPHIGDCYGGTTVKRNMIYDEVIEPIKKNPDGRRNITCLWQIDDFKNPHGLKPCAFLTIWNVRHDWDGVDYLDMTMVQRSSDYLTAGCINQVQYVALQKMVAKELNLVPGKFTWKPINIQIYDRHIEGAIDLLNRKVIDCSATIEVKDNINKFKDFTKEDVYINDYPKEKIMKKNPQIKLQLGI